jgi:ligand-binding sensor protein
MSAAAHRGKRLAYQCLGGAWKFVLPVVVEQLTLRTVT